MVAALTMPTPTEVVVVVDGVGDTEACGRSVGDTRVFEEAVERVGEMSRSGCREERLF